jgi:RNA polymerase sigma factor (sigma-70 family)
MQNCDDQELLRLCGTKRSDEAFSILVSRHLDFVYSSALRQVRDQHLAKDVAQSVFLLLVKKSRTLHRDTILTGWLYRTTRFVVSDTLRAENRRRAREHAAMQPPISEPYNRHTGQHAISHEPRWEEIEPLLDDAIATLNEQDRDLVLLRYFEKQSLKEVGRRLGINEDTAQKRVSRALDKLRAFFAAQGASTTTVALATMLSTSAVQSAPAGVASAILAVVAPAAGVALSSFTLQSLLETMALTKTKAVIATALLVALTVPVVTQNRALKNVRDENQALKASLQTQAAPPGTTDAAPGISAADIARLRSDAAEVHRLRGEVTLLRQASRNAASAPTKPADPLDPAVQNNPMERMNLGRGFMAQGKYPEALEHFLWCYDEGLKHSPSYVGVRSSFLLNDLKKLANVYPQAKEALLARRDAAEESIINTSADLASVFQYNQLNEHLDQPAQTVELFDQLPVGHRARAAIVDVALEQFLTARRYNDILEAGNPEATFDRAKSSFSSLAANSPGREDLQGIIRRRAVENGASALEALAGAGQVDRAIALANSVLDFDSSPETRGQLLKHAQRAGHPQVLAHLQNPTPR